MDAADQRRGAAGLLRAGRWFALGTVDGSGMPSVTYVPFARVDGSFGIVVSRLAAHTADLVARRPASVLLVDDELERRDAYARARFSIQVTASPQAAGSASAGAIWSALEARHGETVRILRELPDFEAILLEPLRGRLVLGFASAHDLRAETIVELLRSAG